MYKRNLDSYFQDWYGEVFGFEYGSGEIHILSCVKNFMELVDDKGKYDYEYMEETLGGGITWLIIDVFCHKDIIEYGTSPRAGWIEPCGMAVREYLKSKSLDELVNVVCDYGPNGDGMNQFHCSERHCNCPDTPDIRGVGCDRNPFFSLFYKGNRKRKVI